MLNHRANPTFTEGHHKVTAICEDMNPPAIMIVRFECDIDNLFSHQLLESLLTFLYALFNLHDHSFFVINYNMINL